MAITSSTNSVIRAVVAIPPVCDFYFTPHRFSCLGAQILCNLLSNIGIKPLLHVFPLSLLKSEVIDLPQEISYLNNHIIRNETGKLSYFTKYQRFGPSAEECATIISKESPDICFISSFAFSYSYDALSLAKHLKKTSSSLQIVLGGAGPSAYPLYFIRDTNIDFVLVGEAEVSIKLFLDAFINKSIGYEDVPNLYWKNDGNINFDTRPVFSDSNQIDIFISKTYETKKSISFSTSLTRGCNKTCKFCSNFLTHGNTFRTVPFEKVLKAIKSFSSIENAEKKNIFINFEDDNLLLDTEYFLKVLKSFKKVNPEISFLAENGLDYSLLTPEVVNDLIDSGLVKFNLSLASIDPAILETEKRPLFLEHYKEIVATIATRNIPCITYFICGFKNDTKKSIARTLAFLANQPVNIGISLFYPVPGIHGFENLKIFDELPLYCCNSSSAYPWNGSLSTSTLITAFRLSRFVNLQKQKVKSEIETKIVKMILEKHKLFTFVKTHQGMEISAVNPSDQELVEEFFNA
jgi:anaerobic magnesium-protoporphyrin IX monomethyl ester cyclase